MNRRNVDVRLTSGEEYQQVLPPIATVLGTPEPPPHPKLGHPRTRGLSALLESHSDLMPSRRPSGGKRIRSSDLPGTKGCSTAAAGASAKRDIGYRVEAGSVSVRARPSLA